MYDRNFLERVKGYEPVVKQASVEEMASAVAEEKELSAEDVAAIQKFASLPLEEAIELLKPVVKTASFIDEKAEEKSESEE